MQHHNHKAKYHLLEKITELFSKRSFVSGGEWGGVAVFHFLSERGRVHHYFAKIHVKKRRITVSFLYFTIVSVAEKITYLRFAIFSVL